MGAISPVNASNTSTCKDYEINEENGCPACGLDGTWVKWDCEVKTTSSCVYFEFSGDNNHDIDDYSTNGLEVHVKAGQDNEEGIISGPGGKVELLGYEITFMSADSDLWRFKVCPTDSVEKDLSHWGFKLIQNGPKPGIGLSKTVEPGTAKVGDNITNTYTITNTGDCELTGITLYDDVLETITLDTTVLQAGKEMSVNAEYTVEEDDADPLVNTATVTGYYGGTDDDYVSAEATASVDIISEDDEVADIELEKEADVTSAKVGETITYTYTVTNTGNVTLENISVEDDPLGTISLTETDESVDLAAGSSIEGKKTYVVQPEDLELEDRELINSATATGYYEGTAVTDTADFTVKINNNDENEPGIELKKEADRSTARVGNTITYTFIITNTGDYELRNLALVDNILGEISLGDAAVKLEVGDELSEVADYRVTGSASDPLVNTATVTAEYGEGETISAKAKASVDIVTSGGGGGGGGSNNPRIEIEKEADVDEAEVGDTITYTYTVTNTGNTRLTGITAEDDKLGEVELGKTELRTGESTSGVLEYVAEEEDIGALVNTVTVKGWYSGTEVTGTAEESVNIIQQDAGPIEVPQEPPVAVPQPEPEPQPGPVEVPEEPPVAQPPDLPFTGGNPMAYISLGIGLAGLGLLLRKRL